ncbi:MAG: EAL domain-containing protein [Thiotrichales bacterium]|nr:MAG: EAL domain-containing protein [Thiotrichales bacterium]
MNALAAEAPRERFSEESAINLIVIDESFDTEEHVVSALRSEGYAARSTRVEDAEDLIEALKKKEPDLVLYTKGMELISLRETCDCIRQHLNGTPVPVIAVKKDGDEESPAAAMRDGAADLSSYNDMDHLRLVIGRELTALRSWRQMHRLETRMTESERRCESLLDSSRDSIAYVHEGMHVYSNASYLELFGLEESDELEGMPILDMVAPDNRDEFKSFLRDYLQNEASTEIHNTLLQKPDGTKFEGEMEFSPASVEGEPCIQVIIRKQDVNTEALEEKLKELSQKDQLTGLYNRQYCLDRLEDTISKCESEGCSAALMEIRLDNFDDIKGRIGAVYIDKFFVEVARALSAATRKNDTLSFMNPGYSIIAYNQDQNSIGAYAKEIQNAIMELDATISNEKINTTCCIGVTLIDKNSPETNEVLRRADKVSNEAAEAGTNQIKVYVPEEGELTRHEVESRYREQLTQALKEDKFTLLYQPIISLHGDTDERYEVFVRMLTDDGEDLIMPQDFLPAAERIGMSMAIDRWVLYRAIQDVITRHQQGKHVHFFIKLSAASIKDETLIEWLNFQIKDKGLPENSLNFVVKESAAVTNLKSSKDLAENLKKIKCGFVLDDFGSGTNPFQLLDHIKADYIRLDKNFMDDLADNPQNQDTIKNITEQASELGKFTIAQFVKDANSLSLLWGMGVNFIQGYFLQEPQAEMNYDFTDIAG